MKHLGTKIIETDRLILRPFKISDADAIYKNWASDKEVTKFLTWEPHKSVEVTKIILKDWVSSYKSKNYYHWAITLKDNVDKPIGAIGVVDYREDIKMVHVGYCMGRKWWNKGITSEAFISIIDFLINEVKVNRIESRHDPNNPNSGKVMMKCGLKYEGTIREGDINNQGICDYSIYGIIASDFIRNNEIKTN